jgi:serine/threonine protein kinase
MSEQDVEARVGEIIASTLQRRESGDPVSDEEILAAHPDLAYLLSEKLKQLALLATARKLAESNSGEETILIGQDSSTKSEPGERADTVYPGQKIRHYVLEEWIGEGGFGSVWRARDSKLECDVAVKIPRRELSPEDTVRFIEEARVSAQLRKHPNIVSVHEADWEADTAFIVSDYIDGLSLDARLDESRIPFNESAELLITICNAIHHAHDEGIIHRDLKPDNILLDRSGVPHITDFGLAMRESQIHATVSGRITGTAAYMSPEQARGESDSADCRSDIFSLGIVFFELLTGEKPFRGSVQHILRQITSTEPPRPRSFDPRIPADLETICLKCLEKDRTRRYQSANELSEDLQRFRRREPIQARPVSAAGRLLRWSQRNPSIPLLSLSLMVVTIVATWASFRFLETEVGEMQKDLTGRAQESLELLSEYAAHEANLNLALRFDQVRSMKADLGLEAITQLADWNSTNELDREIVLGQLIRSKGNDTPIKLFRIQKALDDLKKQTQDPDIRDRTYSVFVCDAQGIQIARAPMRDTIGTDFAFRSYFTGRGSDGVEGKPPEPVWREETAEPRLSECFRTRNGGRWVMAVSVPIWHSGELQGVVGTFFELGDLVRDPETAEATDKMLVFDVRQGLSDARLIHNQGQEIRDIEPIDLSHYLSSLSSGEIGKHPISGSGRWRIATKDFKQSSDPDPERRLFEVMMVEEAATIEDPGLRLRANLRTIGLSVVGFAALLLIVTWIIILQRVVKT